MTKGYIDNTNVCMSNKKLKGFSYDENSLKDKPPIDFITDIQINLKSFYETIIYFDRLKIERIIFEVKKDYLILSNSEGVNKINVKIPIIKNKGEDSLSKYSVDYLKTFLKNYSMKEINTKSIRFKFNKEYPIKIILNKDWFVLAPVTIED